MNFSDFADYDKTLKPINNLSSTEISTALNEIAELIIEAIKKRKKIFFLGNGGSAAEASHFAAELVSKCVVDHAPWAAISLADSTPIITAIGNDYGFNSVFSRQIEALAHKDDVVIAFSTSGTSPNVLAALEKSNELKCKSVLFTGQKCPETVSTKYLTVIAPSDLTPRVQEIHLLWIHLLSEYCEKIVI
jgi:D-sedoheptulose 7-phosphate isomerase